METPTPRPALGDGQRYELIDIARDVRTPRDYVAIGILTDDTDPDIREYVVWDVDPSGTCRNGRYYLTDASDDPGDRANALTEAVSDFAEGAGTTGLSILGGRNLHLRRFFEVAA